MTFTERNKTISELLNDFQAMHDKYTSSTRIMTDDEWTEYVNAMTARVNGFKRTNLYNIASALWMAFLDDTEYVQKELRKIHD